MNNNIEEPFYTFTFYASVSNLNIFFFLFVSLKKMIYFPSASQQAWNMQKIKIWRKKAENSAKQSELERSFTFFSSKPFEIKPHFWGIANLNYKIQNINYNYPNRLCLICAFLTSKYWHNPNLDSFKSNQKTIKFD